MTGEPAIAFSTDGPFFPMVARFMLATAGLGPLYQPDNPLRLSSAWGVVSYHGRVELQLDVDLEQLRQMTAHLDLATAVQQLCGMLIIAAHAVAAERIRNDATTLQRPEMEFFRHVRNAAAHGNRFTFVGAEPRRDRPPVAARLCSTLLTTTHRTLGNFSMRPMPSCCWPISKTGPARSHFE